MEISYDEPVLIEPARRALIHDYYGETLQSEVTCYRLEEIIAEKLRTLLQTHAKLVTRGWNRPRSRDYYDLWQILKKFGGDFLPGRVIEILGPKNAHRNVFFQITEDFFSKELVSEASRNWENSLGAFVIDLPEFDQVMQELKPLIHQVLKGS
jgi:predicted nucleotidyltransferase component of viral defense system